MKYKLFLQRLAYLLFYKFNTIELRYLDDAKVYSIQNTPDLGKSDINRLLSFYCPETLPETLKEYMAGYDGNLEFIYDTIATVLQQKHGGMDIYIEHNLKYCVYLYATNYLVSTKSNSLQNAMYDAVFKFVQSVIKEKNKYETRCLSGLYPSYPIIFNK